VDRLIYEIDIMGLRFLKSGESNSICTSYAFFLSLYLILLGFIFYFYFILKYFDFKIIIRFF